MTILEEIYAFGHKNIIATHKTTIEITKDKSLTKRGNCIVGINATKACFDLNSTLKKEINANKKIKITLKVENIQDSFHGFGSKELKLLNKHDLVFRTSNYICNRTVLINCTKSSNEINRKLVEKLQAPGTELSIIFELNESNGNQE
ncbi:MAG: DUF371 domain-containing protein [Candidatus Thorarchaeota archaeon]